MKTIKIIQQKTKESNKKQHKKPLGRTRGLSTQLYDTTQDEKSQLNQ